MARLRKCRRATVLSMLLASAQAASLPVIFQRQETCAAQGFSPCGDGLPASFCCQAGATCITLAGNSTVLCCPEGTNCDRISPITCNVSLQDPEAHPDAVIKTTALKSKLTTCGTRCCPFGYDCNGADQCVKKADQSELPSELPASELPTSTPGPTSSVAIPTVIPTIIATTSPETTEPGTSSPSAPAQQGGNDGGGNKNTFPTAIVIGVLCGILAGVGIGVALLICLSRRRRNAAARQNEKKRSRGPRPSTSTSSFGNIISEPIPTSDSAFRTDFILKTPSTGTSTFSPTKRPGQAHFRNSSTTTLAHDPIGLARSDSKPRTPDRNNISVPPIRGMRPNSGRRPPAAQNPLLAPPPQLLQQHLQREPSSESINVFADPVDVLRPGQRRMTSATTFTDLMDEADLGDVRRGKPFVPQTPKTPGRR